MATGTQSAILVHISRQEDFKPLPAGRVTASLVTGDRSVSQTLEEAVRPGIYRFKLEPETAGESRLVFEVEWPGGRETIDGGSLMVHTNHHRAIHAAEDLLEEVPGAIIFTKEQSWAISFSTGVATRRYFGPVIKTVGEVLPARGDEAIITAQASGIVRFARRRLYAGTAVRTGETLIRITSGTLADNNLDVRYQEALNRFERSHADHERMTRLAEQKLVTERELLLARQEYLDARMAYENLARTYSRDGHAQKSPVNGYLSQLMVEEGQFVQQGQVLGVVSQNRDLVVKAMVQQRYAGILDDMVDAHIGLADGTIYPLEALQGSILSVARNIDPRTHLLPVYLEVQGQRGLVPGGLTDVFLKAGSDHPVLVVPNTALIEEQGNFFVFVQIHPESFVKREVMTGSTDGLMTVITAGLTEGERIVTRGAIMVKMAASAGELDPHSGHVH